MPAHGSLGNYSLDWVKSIADDPFRADTHSQEPCGADRRDAEHGSSIPTGLTVSRHTSLYFRREGRSDPPPARNNWGTPTDEIASRIGRR
jgi:hypothetical protein